MLAEVTKLTLTKAAHGGTFKLCAGDRFTMALEENPTTGYRWQISADAGIDILASEYAPLRSNAIGGGGNLRITLLAKDPGSFQIKSKMLRPWAGESSVIDRCTFTVLVSDPGTETPKAS